MESISNFDAVTYRTGNDAIRVSIPKINWASQAGMSQAEAWEITTAAGIPLVVGGIFRAVQGNNTQAGLALAVLKNIFLERVRVSTNTNVPEIILLALESANENLLIRPEFDEVGIAALIAVTHGGQLFLARVGNCSLALLRGESLVFLTGEMSHPLSGSGGDSDATQPNRTKPSEILIGQNPHLPIDQNIYLPGLQPQSSLPLQPGDSFILGAREILQQVIDDQILDLTLEDLSILNRQENPAVLAEKIAQVEDQIVPEEREPFIVMKTENGAVPVPYPFQAGSCLRQGAIITAILIVSIGLGLLAAYGLPALSSAKAVPSTRITPVPAGFMSVLSVDGDAKSLVPGSSTGGSSPINLAAGALVPVIPGMQVQVGTGGDIRFQLSDGTMIALGSQASVGIQTVADPKSGAAKNELIVQNGQVLVNSTQADGSMTQITAPDGAQGSVLGTLMGVQYGPIEARFDADCLQGTCKLLGKSASRDLAGGQHSWVTHGQIGGTDPARWGLWSGLCAGDCPQATPTPAPTPLLAPYLGLLNWPDLFNQVRFEKEIGTNAVSTPQKGVLAATLLGFMVIVLGAIRGVNRVAWMARQQRLAKRKERYRPAIEHSKN